MSIWEDVRFDECAAELHVRRLVAAARALGEAAATLQGDAPVVTDDWRGASRERFDGVLDALVRTVGAAVTTVEGAAVLVRVRSNEAAAEQRRRLRAREDFVGPVLVPR